MVRFRHIALMGIILVGCDLIVTFDLRDGAPVDSDTDPDGDADRDDPGDADGDVDTDSDSDTDVDADTDTDSDADGDSDSDSDTDRDADEDPDVALDADPDVELPTCSPAMRGEVLGHFTFDTTYDESEGRHRATPVAGETCLRWAPGRDEACANALRFNASCTSSWVEIEDSDVWSEVSSIDLWIFPGTASPVGYLTRDAMGYADGQC